MFLYHKITKLGYNSLNVQAVEYIEVKACSYFQISFTTMKVFLLCALFGAALSEVFFEEKFDDGDAWTKR
jgi:hypothetical protein